MNFTVESKDFNDYLIEDSLVDYNQSSIKEKVQELFIDCDNDILRIKKAYEFVRDEIAHSCDIKSERIAKKASEVLIFKEGICYSKTLLFAALLRSVKIPAGFCYQLLTLQDTPEEGYCIHALNGVYLSEFDRWVRLDARGNKKGIDAQFSIDKEQLAFHVRHRFNEKDFPLIYANPNKKTIDTLNNNTNCIEMCKTNLPTEL